MTLTNAEWTSAETTAAEAESETGEVGVRLARPFSAPGYSAEAEAEYQPQEQAGELHAEISESEHNELTESSEFAAFSPFTHAEAAEDREVLENEFLNELAGSELSEAIGELAQEWSGIHAEISSNSGQGVTPPALREAGTVLTRRADEVATELDRMLETLGETLGEHTATTIGESELASFLELTESPPIPIGASPAQEQFFRKFARIVGRVARGAVSLAKKGVSLVGKIASWPLRMLFSKLGQLARGLLRGVLNSAISRLPVVLQAPAQQLRVRLFGREAELEGEGEGETESLGEVAVGEHGGWSSERALADELEGETVWRGAIPAVGGAQELESEFVTTVSRALAAENEAELAQLEAEYAASAAESEAAPGASELDAARVTLVRELAELRDGESAGPAIERFLPAILPALRIGIRLVGRQRVINLLASVLDKLIRPLVGPRFATPLTRAFLDIGMKAFTLEASAEDRELAGASGVASLLEDTLRRVAERGNEVFTDTNRLHSETVAAFSEAVAHTIPSSLIRGDLESRETSGQTDTTWMLRPRVYWYRKYARVFEITLTPQIAAAITTFGGVRLLDVLRARGVRLPVKVRVHLYETLPGTYLSRISQLEKDVPGMTADGWRQFHTLTVAAAGTLLGEPGLGVDVDPRFTRDRSTVAAGQRFFYLQLPGGGGGVAKSLPSQAWVTIDARPGQDIIRLTMYLSEPDAQAVAARARQRNTTAFVIALRAAIQAAMYSLKTNPRSRLIFLREASNEAPAAAAGAGAAILNAIISKIVDRLVDAAIRLAADYARAKSDEFVKAVDNPAAGVSIQVTVPIPSLSTFLFGPLASVIGAARILGAILSNRLGMRTVPGLRK
ncbi:hypothetical protein [Leifsonia sp. NPDC077715]|uniref:hypothetical protein n=1 Tax=Leifsonia sp. NPDC077715 TaxID=3155539 RepID=UPI00342E5210